MNQYYIPCFAIYLPQNTTDKEGLILLNILDEKLKMRGFKATLCFYRNESVESPNITSYFDLVIYPLNKERYDEEESNRIITSFANNCDKAIIGAWKYSSISKKIDVIKEVSPDNVFDSLDDAANKICFYFKDIDKVLS